MKTTTTILFGFLAATTAFAQQYFPPMDHVRPSGERVDPRMYTRQISKRSGARTPLAVEGSWDSIFKSRTYDELLDNGYVNAIASDGDNLYIGGSFEYFNGVRCYNIIQYNKATDQWSKLGLGFDATVTSLAVLNGKLYAGGFFWYAGFNSTTPLNGLAEWNGTTWRQVGGGVDGEVRALAVVGNDLYVGGYFSHAGSVAADNIARWNGSSWNTVDDGLNDAVNCFLVDGDSLYVGGYFYDNVRSMHGVALLENGTWNTLNGGFSGEALSLALFDSSLWVGGDILSPSFSDPHIGLIKWDGDSWNVSTVDGTPVAQGGIVWALYASANLLYIGGSFSTIAGEPASGLAVYTDAKQFLPISGGGTYGAVRVLAPFNNDIYVGGNFLMAGDIPCGHLAKLTHGDVWSSVGPQAEAQGGYSETWVTSVAPNGRYVFSGGSFTTVAGIPANNIAQFDRQTGTWSALGAGVDAEVWGMTLHDGKLYAGGEFNHAGGMAARHIAYWDIATQTWHAMGEGSRRFVDDIAIAGGQPCASVFYEYVDGEGLISHLGKWNGSEWTEYSDPFRGYVNCMAASGDSVCIGGIISEVDGTEANNIALHTANGWDMLGDGVSERVADILMTNGQIYAGGWFGYSGSLQLNGIGRWDGSQWNTLGGMDGGVRSIAWRDGILFAAGNFTMAGSVPANFLASWNGQEWSEVAGGTENANIEIAVDDRSLYAGGHFVEVGQEFFSYRFAILDFEKGSVDDKNANKRLSMYPNPLATKTTIKYELEGPGFLSIGIYDLRGVCVREVHPGWQSGGEHEYQVDLHDLAPAMYVCRLSSDEGEAIQLLEIQR